MADKPSHWTLDRWLATARPVLEDFADRAFQERAWFNRGPEVSSPTEVLNHLKGFMFAQTSQDPSFALTVEQRAACARFADMVHAFAREHKRNLNEHEVINDPDWEKIRQAATELLKTLPSG